MNIEQHAAFRDKAQQSSLIKIELIGSPPPPPPPHCTGGLRLPRPHSRGGGRGRLAHVCVRVGGWPAHVGTGIRQDAKGSVCMCVAFAGICLHGP